MVGPAASKGAMRTRRTLPHPTYALLSLGEATIDDSAFAHRTGRLGGALGTAVVTHVVVVLAMWALAALRPAEPASKVAPASSLPALVFVGATGAGARSGGEGGGNRSALAAVLVRTRPADATAVPMHPDTAPRGAGCDRARSDGDQRLGPARHADGRRYAASGRGPGRAPVTAHERERGGRGPGNQPRSRTWIWPRRRSRPGPGGRGNGGDDIYGVGNGVTAPTILFQTSPRYTPDAVRAKLQGAAVVSAVVGPDGTLRDIRIVRSLDATFGLDQEAIACVRQWRFRPGTRQGAPVAVSVTIEVAFTLR